MEDLGYKQDVTEVEQDNKSCMILAQRGPGRGGRSKSINVKFFWINEQIENKIIKLKYVESDRVIADGLTKPLPKGKFEQWRDRILNLQQS